MHRPQTYHKAYACLLRYHCDQGFSPETFCVLATSKQQIVQEDPQAKWVHGYKDFIKRPVSPQVVLTWRQEHRDFQQAYAEGWRRGLFFYEKQLLYSLRKRKSQVPHQIVLSSLRIWFARVYDKGESAQQEEACSVRDFPDIRDINDPKELFRLARMGSSKKSVPLDE